MYKILLMGTAPHTLHDIVLIRTPATRFHIMYIIFSKQSKLWLMYYLQVCMYQAGKYTYKFLFPEAIKVGALLMA